MATRTPNQPSTSPTAPAAPTTPPPAAPSTPPAAPTTPPPVAPAAGAASQPAGNASDALKQAEILRDDAQRLADEAAADRAAAEQLLADAGSRVDVTPAPASASLEPFAVARRSRPDMVIEERVSVRASGFDRPPAFDPTAPMFPAKARMLPSGRFEKSAAAERQNAPMAEVPLIGRTLHNGVLYEATPSNPLPADMTEAQFNALKLIGATAGVWPGD